MDMNWVVPDYMLGFNLSFYRKNIVKLQMIYLN
jgi:hypothetical protein